MLASWSASLASKAAVNSGASSTTTLTYSAVENRFTNSIRSWRWCIWWHVLHSVTWIIFKQILIQVWRDARLIWVWATTALSHSSTDPSQSHRITRAPYFAWLQSAHLSKRRINHPQAHRWSCWRFNCWNTTTSRRQICDDCIDHHKRTCAQRLRLWSKLSKDFEGSRSHRLESCWFFGSSNM